MKKSSFNHMNTSVTNILVFNNPEFGRVRLSLTPKGEPLFCGKDVCDVLGYSRTDNAVRQHVQRDDALKQCVISQYSNKATGKNVARKVQMLFVTESGLYALVLGSKLDSAQRFKHWVTAVVLPQIRKTGGFIPISDGDTDEDIRKRTEQILRKTIAEKQILIDELLPKALYADNVLDSISCYTTTQIAKELGCTAQELNRSLCAAHIQYYQSGQYLLYADYAHMGLAKSRTRYQAEAKHVCAVSAVGIGLPADHLHGMAYSHSYLVWTERGRKFIHDLAKKYRELAKMYEAR